MTLEELFKIPKGMSLEEYEKLLKEKQKLERKIRKASDDIFFEEDSLQILSDEVGSERYNKHLENKRRAMVRIEKARVKLTQINDKLKG